MNSEPIPIAPPEQQKSQAPICPHCLADPYVPDALPFNVENGVQLLVIFCAGCRKVVSVVILKIPQPRVQPPSPNGRIVMP